MELVDFINWLLVPGAGALTYWLVENIPYLSALHPRNKRFAAFALSSVIAILAYLASVAMQYQPAPETWRAWIEALFSVAAVASGLSQIIHGVRKLS